MSETHDALVKAEARAGVRKLCDTLPEALAVPLRAEYALRVERYLARFGRRLLRLAAAEGSKP